MASINVHPASDRGGRMTLHVPPVDSGVDTLAAALAYAKAGWYIVPVKHGSKHPGSVVGFGWNDKSSRDPEVIIGWYAGTDHGIALHAGRSGAVVFDVDTPDKLPAVLTEQFAATRPPMQATRRGNDQRGHYLFTQPPGRTLGNGTGRLGGEWGEIRGANGVIIVAPSAHESADGEYRWVSVGPLPVLPDVIGEQLHDASPAEDACTDLDIAAFLARHTGNARPELVEAWVATYRRKVTAGESRHDRAVSVLAGMLKEAAAGYFPASSAAAALRTEFLAAVAKPPTGRQGTARAGQQAADEWSGILAWAVGQARAADPAETVARFDQHAPGDVRTLVAPTPTGTVQVTTRADGTAALHTEQAPAVAYLDESAATKPRTSWWPRDLEPFLTGIDLEPGPAYLTRTDEQHLFYAGKVNGVIGESESGKTWVALLAVVQAITDGIPVTYFDFEDTGAGVVTRLRALAAPDEQLRALFRYVGPDESLDAAAAGDLTEHLDQHRPGLVVLDGMNAAMTLMGLDLMSNTDATIFAQKLLRPIAITGACVVYVDHVPKAKDNESKGGIGAQAKRAMTTGATLRAEVILPFGRGQSGKIKLTVDKDRPGHVRGNSGASRTVGTVVITPGLDDTLSLVIEAPDLRPASEREPFRPTGLMEKVCGVLATLPDGASGAQLEREVSGKASAIREAVQRLVEEGFVQRSSGPRNSTLHTLLRRYSEAAEMAGEYANERPDPAPRPTSSHLVPDEVPSGGVDLVPRPRPPTEGGGEGRGHAGGVADEAENDDLVPPPRKDELAGLADAELIRAVRANGGTPAYVCGELVDTTTGEIIDRSRP